MINKRVNTAKWNENKKYWQINVQKNGKRKSFYSSKKGRTGQRECNTKADNWLNEDLIGENTKASELYEKYIEEKALNVGRSRLDNIKSMFNAYILKMIGNRKVISLSEQDLQDILNEQFKNGNSHARIRETKIVIQDFIKFARKNNITNLYPENLYVNKKAPKPKRGALTKEDIETLFTSDKTIAYGKPKKDIYINYYRFMLLTGLRRGELLGLKWSDVKLPIIEIKRSKNAYNELTKGKTDNAKRFVPLNDKAIEILNEMDKKSKFIFPINRPQTLTDKFKIYAEYNNLKCSKLHELRHTFISYTDNALPLNTLKSIVGHSEKMRTVDTYGHIVNEEIEKARIILNDLF